MGNCCGSNEPEEISDYLNISQKSRSVNLSNPTTQPTLETVDSNSIEFIPYRNKIIDAKVVEVYDGDTFTIIYNYRSEFLKTKIRVLGLDTPEMHIRGDLKGTDIGNLEERAGKRVKDAVNAFIGGEIIQVKMKNFDKYGGRINGIIYLPANSDYSTLTDYLIDIKYAKPYLGGKKEPWTIEELQYILDN